jgi:hypothetical protein
MKFLSYELAKQLQDAGFPEYWKDRYSFDDLICMSMDFEVPQIFQVKSVPYFLSRGYIMLPSFEDIMQDELMRGFAYQALPEPLVYNSTKPYKDQISFSGASAVEAAARAWLFLHDKKKQDGSLSV